MSRIVTSFFFAIGTARLPPLRIMYSSYPHCGSWGSPSVYCRRGTTTRRILFAGFLARMGEARLPRVMFVEMLGGKGYSGGQEWDWMKGLEEDLRGFGIKFEAWHEAAQKVGKWFRRVEEGAEVFMRKSHMDEKEATAERHRTVATPTLNGGASTRAREEMGGCLLYTSPSPRD